MGYWILVIGYWNNFLSKTTKALQSNAYRHYSLFTIHYSLTSIKVQP